MKQRGLVVLALLVWGAIGALAAEGRVTGELKTWHRVTVSLAGPEASEGGTPNPFRNARLNVAFSQGKHVVVVPGFSAADGNAAESGATKGNVWRAHFAPGRAGAWRYVASFRTGKDVAASLDANAGRPAAFDGASGTFTIAPTDRTGRDHRAKGLLRYVGERYLQFAATKEWFLKGGADSPENFLGYADFDGTYKHSKPSRQRHGEALAKGLHEFKPHVRDWRPGDPTWRGGKGKGMIGALNYLASTGMNSVYMLTMNVTGDGKDVWPWVKHDVRDRFDCSKLAQWEIVFGHMDRLGLMLHLITQETENDQLLDGGELGLERRLYYRELVARFGHHLALVWNLGEENTNTDAQRKAFAKYLHDLDPYDHPVVCHTFPGRYDQVYNPLLGYEYFEGPSLQTNDTHRQTLRWVERSAKAGRKWIVCLDEIGPAHTGVKPDADDPAHDEVRHKHLWGNLMAGGAGCEWYMGYKFAHNDLNCEDWRSREAMWRQTRIALEFFQRILPFATMRPADHLVDAEGAWCFAKPGEVYAIYLPSGGTTKLNFGKLGAAFNVQWFDPRKGGALQDGTVRQAKGPGWASVGLPPAERGKDWVCRVSLPAGARVNASLAEVEAPAAPSDRGAGSVTGLTLINADTGQVIGPLADGATLDLGKLPPRIAVRADASAPDIGGVRFALDGKTVRTERTAPYALAGDQNGKYAAWSPRPGRHVLTATPMGKGRVLRITFTVVAGKR